MRHLTRRGLLRGAVRAMVGGAAYLATGCLRRVVEVERVTERQVTKVVTKVVRETVIVAATPSVVAKTPTLDPAPTPARVVIADVMDYGWDAFAAHVSEAFRDVLPDTTIRWQSRSSWSSYAANIAALAASGALGDLIECPPGDLLSAWTLHEIIQPLNSLTEAAVVDLDDLFEPLLRAYRRDGLLMALPFLASPGASLLITHADALGSDSADMGWDALVARLRDARPEATGLELDSYLPRGLPLTHSFGVELISAAGDLALPQAESAEAMLAWLLQAMNSGRIASPFAPAADAATSLLGGNSLGLQASLSEWIQLQQRAQEAGLVAVALPPSAEKSTPAVATGMAYAIPKRSDSAEAAMHWMQLMASAEMGVQMCLANRAEPGARPSAWLDRRITERLPVCAQLASLMETARPIPGAANMRTSACWPVWNGAIAASLSGAQPITFAVAEAQEEIQSILARPPLRLEEMTAGPVG